MNETLFEAVIMPHRSLSRRGRRILLGAIAAICCVNATVFIHIGAWPVGGFTGIELLLATVMLSINARAARASEMIMLSASGVRIVNTDVKGKSRERTLPSAWFRVLLEERPGRVPALLLVSHGRQEEIARALGEAEKRNLASAMEQAIRRWRSPEFDNPVLRERAEGLSGTDLSSPRAQGT